MKISRILIFCSCCIVLFHRTSAQQIADTLFSPVIPKPAYSADNGSVVLIDEAHENFHKVNGRFKPFASVLRKDGYRVGGLATPFTNESLSRAKILVIANALHASNLGNWKLPTPSAFTDDEIVSLNAWVKNGGSLFLIADHMPMPGAAEKLAASFGFKFYNCFARKKKGGADIFTSDNGLKENTLTRGTTAEEKVTSLQSFTGQAFEIPAAAVPVIVLNDDYEILLPEVAWEFNKDTPTTDATGKVQGAFMKYGAGRIVVFGEAAMFSAQTANGNKFGMNAPTASQNVQFLLNVIHWLDGITN